MLQTENLKQLLFCREVEGLLKATFSLSYSIAKRNKGFTLGLVIMFMVLTTIIIMERYTTASVRSTINDYTEEYCAPDLWVVTEPLPLSMEDLLPDYPAITGYEYSMVMNVRCRVRSKEIFVLDLTSITEDGFRKYYFSEEKHATDDVPEIAVSSYFAKSNGIQSGDTVELMTAEGYREFFVSALVSCPENMFCSRDSTSWCDSADFGYLYLKRNVMDEYFPTTGYANLWSFRISKDCTADREEKILEDLSATFGSYLISADMFSTSDIKTQLEAELDQTEAATRFMPVLSYVVGVFFTCLFIQQVMQGERKTIGLLRALGYTSFQVLNIFILYMVAAGIIGMALGFGLGAFLTRYSISIYQNTYSLPFIRYSANIPILILLLAVIFVIGIVSCFFRAKIITRMNPAEAYGEQTPTESPDLPKSLKKLHMNEMIKIAVVSTFRNRKRFLLSAVSIGASMVISLASIVYGFSSNAAQIAAFGDQNGNNGRFRYDALIRFTGENSFCDIVRETSGVSDAEPVIVLRGTLNAGEKSLELQINALSENSDLLVPKDQNGHSLQPGDGIILEEIAAKTLGVGVGDEVSIGNVNLKVIAIAREVVNSIQYISFGTAERLGYNVPNEVAVRFESDADHEDVCAALSKVPGFHYSILREHQALSVSNGCRAKNTAMLIATVLAFVLGLIIVYNMVVLSVEEKKLEYATLIALGTPVEGFLGMAVVENALRYLSALIPGIPLGCLVANIALNSMSSLKTSYPFDHAVLACIITALISLVYLLGGILFTLYKVRSVELSEALNTRG